MMPFSISPRYHRTRVYRIRRSKTTTFSPEISYRTSPIRGLPHAIQPTEDLTVAKAMHRNTRKASATGRRIDVWLSNCSVDGKYQTALAITSHHGTKRKAVRRPHGLPFRVIT